MRRWARPGAQSLGVLDEGIKAALEIATERGDGDVAALLRQAVEKKAARPTKTPPISTKKSPRSAAKVGRERVVLYPVLIGRG